MTRKTTNIIIESLILFLITFSFSFANATDNNGYHAEFVTFYGDSDSDEDGYTMVLDDNGNIYISGITVVNNFRDIFVNKYDSNGKLLISKIIGGSNHETPTKMVINKDGNIVIVGVTKSIDFPTTDDAFNKTFSGQGGYDNQWTCCGDGFLVILSADTLEIKYSTFIGGSDSDSDFGVEISKVSSDMFVFAITESRDFPVTADAYQKTLTGAADIVVMRFTSNGTNLLYSTFLGGNHSYIQRNGLNGFVYAIDSHDNIIVAGGTASNSFITTTNAMNTSFGGGQMDGFITKMASNGSTILFSTFIGGENNDYVASLTIDSSDGIIFAGTTNSPNFPISSNALQNSLGDTACGLTLAFENDVAISCGDMYVAKINSDGTVLHSTLLGGDSIDQPTAIIVDASGTIYLSGFTSSNNIPLTDGAIQSTKKGNWDGYFAKISENLSTLLYSTLFGSSYIDLLNAVHFNDKGEVFLTGFVSYSDYPTIDNTVNSYSGERDMILLKLSPNIVNQSRFTTSLGFEILILVLSISFIKKKLKK